MKPVKIAKDVYCIALRDWDRELFDALIPLPDGTSYNSYIVLGKNKTALIDTADPSKLENFKKALANFKSVDYVVCNHAEQDHSGLLGWVLEKYPAARVVANSKCRDFLKDHLHVPDNKFSVVKDGDELDLGGKTLKFIFTPWVHWPETMCTYLKEGQILFSCDFFGSHLATGDVYSEEKKIYGPLKRYFAKIMLPFSENVKKNLEKVDAYPLTLIAPGHGPAHKDINLVLDLYEDWTVNSPKDKVLIAYVSMHGSTRILAERLEEALHKMNITVEVVNMETADIGKFAGELVDSATVVMGVPTVLAGPHPKAAYIAYLVNMLRPPARYLGIIGSYGWGGKTLDILAALTSNVKAEVFKPVMVRGLPKESDLKEIDNLAGQIKSRHESAGLKRLRTAAEV